MSSGGSGVWLGEEETGKWFRLHQCKGGGGINQEGVLGRVM